MRRLFIIAMVLVLAPCLASAQSLWGFELGAGQTVQQGSFVAPCGCTFSLGSGSDYNVSLLYERQFEPKFFLGIKAGIDAKQFLSSHIYDFPSPTSAMTSSGNIETFSNFSIQDNGQVSTTYITFEPYARYKLFRTPIFVQAGADIGVLAYSHFYQRRDNLTGALNGQTVTGLLYPSGASDTVLENNPLQNISTMRYSALFSAGYDFAIKGLIMSPTITYDFPFTTVRDVDESGWKLSSLYASMTFKFAP
jgi:hypothetical protein